MSDEYNVNMLRAAIGDNHNGNLILTLDIGGKSMLLKIVSHEIGKHHVELKLMANWDDVD